MKRLSQSGSGNVCPELRKNALLISQSYFSNFAFYMIKIFIRLDYIQQNVQPRGIEKNAGSQENLNKLKQDLSRKVNLKD